MKPAPPVTRYEAIVAVPSDVLQESVAVSRKPNSVPAFARPCGGASAGDDHSSSPAITGGIKRPTRKLRTGRPCERFPIWSCSVRGFACHPCYHGRGALLPHLFTLTCRASPLSETRRRGRYIFCATFLQVALTGRYPAHCPAEFGLSSRLARPFEGLLHAAAVVWLTATFALYIGQRWPTARVRHPRQPCRLPVRLLRDLILLELLVQVAARRVDDFGGLRDVPPVLAQLGRPDTRARRRP